MINQHSSISSVSIEGLGLQIGRHTILENINIPTLERGEILAVVGPNGAGKSSLIRCLCGLEKFSGVIRLNNEAVPPLARERRQWAPFVGYVPQDVHISSKLSVTELMLLAQKTHHHHLTIRIDELENAEKILNELEIAHLAQKFCSNLSGGQMQMVALAQAMVLSPSLLLLDEPTSALDLHHQLSTLQLIRNYTRKSDVNSTSQAMAIVIVHDLNLALNYADKILLINNGGVAAHGLLPETLTINLIRENFNVDGEFLQNSRNEQVLSIY